MIDLLTAIQAKWNSTSELMSLSTILYYQNAPDNTPLPFIRIVHVSGVSSYETSNGTFNPVFEDCVFQFDVFTNSNEVGSDVAALNAIETIDRNFNLKPLPLASDSFLSAIRKGVPRVILDDDEAWHGIVSFSFKVVRKIMA